MVTKKNSRNPWAWIPTLYFAEGLPNVIVTALSVVMYMQLGLTDAEVGLNTHQRLVFSKSMKRLHKGLITQGRASHPV